MKTRLEGKCITNTKKLWFQEIKNELEDIDNDDYIECFEEKLNKYGKLFTTHSGNPFWIELEMFEKFDDKDKVYNTDLLDFISK